MMPNNKRLVSHGAAILGFVAVGILAIGINFVVKPQSPVMSFILPSGDWEFTKNTAINDFYGKKIRECPIIPYTWKALAVVNGHVVSEGIEFEWVDETNPEDTFPKGFISIGGIKWTTEYNMIDADKLGIKLYHNCNGVEVPSNYWFALPTIKDRVYND